MAKRACAAEGLGAAACHPAKRARVSHAPVAMARKTKHDEEALNSGRPSKRARLLADPTSPGPVAGPYAAMNAYLNLLHVLSPRFSPHRIDQESVCN